MNLRPLQFLALAWAAVLQSDCILSCPPNPCEEFFHPLRWCATSNMCRLNGQLMICPDCTLSTIASGNTLEVPFDEIWPLMGKRNDLFIRWDSGLTDVELFFDGVPAAEAQCKREPFAQLFVLTCSNLPRSLTSIGIRYTGNGSTEIEFDIRDQECEDANSACLD